MPSWKPISLAGT